MKAVLLVVGKTTNSHLAACIDDYVSRINHYLPFTLSVIQEIKNKGALSERQLREQEGKTILRYIAEGDYVVLLDERGAEYTSKEFASWLEKKQQSSARLVFVIGGAYGFSESIYKRANEQLSLSRMTFSHQMVRLIFAEQLYRACTIIKGEPYHHE